MPTRDHHSFQSNLTAASAEATANGDDNGDNDDPDKFEDDISDNRIGRGAEWRKKQVILIGDRGFFYHFCFGDLYVMRRYNRSLFA